MLFKIKKKTFLLNLKIPSLLRSAGLKNLLNDYTQYTAFIFNLRR